MPIEFSCPQCTQLIRTPDITAGKKGKCPGCAAIVRIPAANEPLAAKTPVPAPKPQPVVEENETGPIEFFCSLCGQLVRTPRAAAGKKGKCPHCQGVLQIPLKSRGAKGSAPPAPAKPAARAQPKPALPEIDGLGLAPLDDLPPLQESKPAKPTSKTKQPVPADEDDDRELRLASNVALPPLGGLAPVGGDLFGGTDPLAQANSGLSGDLFGGTPMANDPFAPLGSSSNYGSASTSLAPATYSPAPSGPAQSSDDRIFVILPAVFQILAVVPFLAWLGFVFASTVFAFLLILLGASEAPPDQYSKALVTLIGLLAGTGIGLGCQIWIIIGSVQMMMLRNYDNCTTAAWLSCVPCFGLFGWPFGIWSLVVLQTPKYQRLFRS